MAFPRREENVNNAKYYDIKDTIAYKVLETFSECQLQNMEKVIYLIDR